MLDEGLWLSETELLGLTEALGLDDTDEDGLTDADALLDGLTLADALEEADAEADALTELDGLVLELGDTDADGDDPKFVNLNSVNESVSSSSMRLCGSSNCLASKSDCVNGWLRLGEELALADGLGETLALCDELTDGDTEADALLLLDALTDDDGLGLGESLELGEISPGFSSQ